MPMKKISYYYQQLAKPVSTQDDIPALIELHRKSFENFGWEVVLADESHARAHPSYHIFDDPTTILNKSINPWEYSRACYMRWLAYATLGHPYADFDVINYGFTPEDAEEVVGLNSSGLPILLSGAGAMGLLDKQAYEQLIGTYLAFIEKPTIGGPLLEDINDMTIMRYLRLDWYNCVPYSDDRFVKDYSRDGWEAARLVHYPHGLTDLPRASTIMKVRPPLS